MNMEPNEIPAEIPAVTPPGHILREARERLGLSVADVANQIKLAPRQIEALEADDFQHLPEMAFVRGFLRSYAKILQLDIQPLLAALPQAVPEHVAPASVEVPFPSAHSPQRQNLIWLGAALLLSVLVVAFAVWHYTTPQPAQNSEAVLVETPVTLPAQIQELAASPVAAAPTMAASSVTAVQPVLPPAVQPTVQAIKPLVQPIQSAVPVTRVPATVKPFAQSAIPLTKPLAQVAAKPLAQSAVPSTKPVALPAVKPMAQSAVSATKPLAQPSQVVAAKPAAEPGSQTASLRIVFDDESWTEVKDKFGKTLSSQVNSRGSEVRLDGRAPFSLVIGHAAKVRVYHRGKQVDLTAYTNGTSEVARLTLE